MDDGSETTRRPAGRPPAAGAVPAAHPADVHLGLRLRELRQQAKLSLTALAARVGLSFQAIQKYESGQNRMFASTLFDLASGLGCTVADFYAGLDPNVAGRLDPIRAPFAAVLDTRSGATLVENYPMVPDRIQDEVAGLLQVLAGAQSPAGGDPDDDSAWLTQNLEAAINQAADERRAGRVAVAGR